MKRRASLRHLLGMACAPAAAWPGLSAPWGQATQAAQAAQTTPDAAQTPSQGHELTPWPAGRKAPPLRALDLQGHAWTLDALRGRVVLLNFWASWCAPCRIELPSLQTLAGFYGDAVQVLAINVGEGPRSILRFVQSSALDTSVLQVLLDPAKDNARAWDAAAVLPTTVLIDAQGQPRLRVRGELDWSGARAQALIDPLL